MPPCHWPQPWAMAKLLRLFPGSLTEHLTNPDVQGYFSIATLIDNSGMRENTDEKCFDFFSFEKELGKMDVPVVVKDFLRSMLVVDYMKRPSAREVLDSEEFRRLG
jgi:hypothetical protein